MFRVVQLYMRLYIRRYIELLAKTKTMGLFIYDHTPQERGRILREAFKSEVPRIFLDLGDIGVIQ